MSTYPPPASPGGDPPYGLQPYGQLPYGGYGQPGAYASWGARVGAYLVDFLIALVLAIPMVIGLVLMTIGIAHDSGESVNGGLVAVGVILMLLGWLSAMAFQIWNYCLRQGRTGATIGKRILGIRLISEQTGQPIGGWLCFARIFVHVIDSAVFYLGYLWPLWDQKGQTWTDKVLGTVVVQGPPVEQPKR